MDYKAILLEKKENIATLTLNRPEKLNALNEQMCEELIDCVSNLAKDATVKVIIISGSGRGFSAGLDLDWGRSMEEQAKRGEQVYDMPTWITKICLALRNMPQPTIASINGAAAGWGVTMPLNCDIRIAAEDARMLLSFVKVGIAPEMASTYMLPRLIGMGKAFELLYTGKTITGKEAKEIGLVNDAVPLAELQAVTSELAKTIAGGIPMIIQLIKKGLYQGLDADLYKQLLWEETTLRLTPSQRTLSKQQRRETGAQI